MLRPKIVDQLMNDRVGLESRLGESRRSVGAEIPVDELSAARTQTEKGFRIVITFLQSHPGCWQRQMQPPIARQGSFYRSRPVRR